MKQFYTLLISALTASTSNAQAVLNEVYAIPGAAKQEFFEFYNSSTTSISMDSYTIVTYFEAGSESGFYVMDLPNLSVGPLGYFVGSSSVPFDYQGVHNSTASQFSWNDAAFLAANNGYLKKWVLGNSVASAIDGNASYDLAPVPGNFNDFFNKIGGSGATYNVFVYKNGVLQSTFLGGTGGSTFLPSYILGLPSLNVDMSGSSTDFTIDFSSYGSVNPEYVIQDVGSDNGYIRTRDGYCGLWTKSDNGSSHTPGVTNGGSGTIIPEISVMAAVVKGNSLSGSTLNYDVVAGTATEFPVTMNVYIDNGSIAGELDANDTYLTSKTETVVSDGPFSSTFFPYTANVIIQTTTSAGCIDNVRFIANTGVLAVKLVSFQGTIAEQNVVLRWSVDENESGKSFEIEKSTDGRSFSKIATVAVTAKTGKESYAYNEALWNTGYYRIKLLSREGSATYSMPVLLQKRGLLAGGINLAQNPIDSYLSFSYESFSQSNATINIYNMSGAKVLSQKMNLVKGINSVTIATDGRIYAGSYVVEVINNQENSRAKFVKY